MAHRLLGLGLPNVFLLDGFRVRGRGEATAYFYDDPDGLYVAIARAVCLAPSPLTAAELRFLRKRLRLTQEELGALVEKKGQTVAKWEKGELPVPRAEGVFVRMRWLAERSSVLELGQFARRAAFQGECAEPTDYRFSRASGSWLALTAEAPAATKRAPRRARTADASARRSETRAKPAQPG